MKMDELRIGLWLTGSGGVCRILFCDSRGALAETPSGFRFYLTNLELTSFYISPIDQLDAANVPDEQRLECQRSNTKRLADGTVLKAGDVTKEEGFWIYENQNNQLVSRMWIERTLSLSFPHKEVIRSERLITIADAPELLRQNFPLDKLPDEIRREVEALRPIAAFVDEIHPADPKLIESLTPPASPNASEKCCGSCQHEATLRDLIEAYDAPVIRTTDWLVALARKFDTARESLGGEGGK